MKNDFFIAVDINATLSGFLREFASAEVVPRVAVEGHFARAQANLADGVYIAVLANQAHRDVFGYDCLSTTCGAGLLQVGIAASIGKVGTESGEVGTADGLDKLTGLYCFLACVVVCTCFRGISREAEYLAREGVAV